MGHSVRIRSPTVQDAARTHATCVDLSCAELCKLASRRSCLPSPIVSPARQGAANANGAGMIGRCADLIEARDGGSRGTDGWGGGGRVRREQSRCAAERQERRAEPQPCSNAAAELWCSQGLSPVYRPTCGTLVGIDRREWNCRTPTIYESRLMGSAAAGDSPLGLLEPEAR
jgi:hypothetical protein